MKIKSLLFLMIGLSLVGMNSTVNATLIGDTVYSQHYSPDIYSPSGYLYSTVVTDDSSDTMRPYYYYDVDVNANEIIVSFIANVMWAYIADGGFTGLVVSDLDDSSGNVLSGITATSTLPGYNTDWITFSDDQVYFNWDGQYITRGSIFSVTLDFSDGNSAPVPEPSTMLLLGTGLLGLVGAARKKYKK